MERPSWLLFKGLRCFHFLKSRQRKCEKSFINSKATEECKMTNTAQIFSFIPILYHFKTYFFAVTATRNLSQLYKNQIPNNKLSKIAFCYHPRLSHNANCPTKIPPSFAHTLPDGPSKTPQTTTSPKFTSSSSHQRLPPTPNFSYERNHITKGSLHPGFFQLSRAAARHQNSLSVAPPWHGVEPFC